MGRTDRFVPGLAVAKFLLGVVITGMLSLVAAPAMGQTTGCAAVTPGVGYPIEVSAGPITVRAADITEPIAQRFADELAPIAFQLADDFGRLDGVEVCLFEDELPLDSVGLGWPEGIRLRAAAFGPERALVLSTLAINSVQEAAILGTVHISLWISGDGSYPEPLAGTVAEWYRSAQVGGLKQDHDIMRFANLIDPIQPISWTEGAMVPLLLWDPQTQGSPIGDFIEFAVGAEGLGVIQQPDARQLAGLQARWTELLRDEATGGGSTTGWIIGLLAAVVGVGLAILFALVDIRKKREGRHDLAGEETTSVVAPTAE